MQTITADTYFVSLLAEFFATGTGEAADHHLRTNGWMDGRTDGWMDGWMGGWVGGWADDKIMRLRCN